MQTLRSSCWLVTVCLLMALVRAYFTLRPQTYVSCWTAHKHVIQMCTGGFWQASSTASSLPPSQETVPPLLSYRCQDSRTLCLWHLSVFRNFVHSPPLPLHTLHSGGFSSRCHSLQWILVQCPGWAGSPLHHFVHFLGIRHALCEVIQAGLFFSPCCEPWRWGLWSPAHTLGQWSVRHRVGTLVWVTIFVE